MNTVGRKSLSRRTPFDGLRVVSTALREPPGREHVESVEPQRTPSINKITNSKLEIRKPKQIQITEISMTKTKGTNFRCLEFQEFEL